MPILNYFFQYQISSDRLSKHPRLPPSTFSSGANAGMVDQNNKPTEGVEAAVEAPEGVNNESLITNDTPEVQQAADAKAEEHSEKDIVQDGAGDVNQDTAQVQVNDGETTDAPETIKDGVEEKSEKVTQEPSSTKDTPKEMLKVTKMGSRQRSDASVLPDSDDPKAIRKQVSV